MSLGEELGAAAGFITPEVAAEFPGLRLDWLTVDARDGGSPPGVRRRLLGLSDRYRGASVVAMRTHAVPRAYRTFYRQIGLDPDATRIPSEEVAVTRLLRGRFESQGLLADALLIALVETGVPVWALDADLVAAGGLGIRASVPGDLLGEGELARQLPPERLVVADEVAIHALLFADVVPGRAPGPRTSRIALYSVGVAGVPAIHIEEALWMASEVLCSV